MEFLFVCVHIMCFFERSASASAHSVNTTDRHRPRSVTCVCVRGYVIMLNVFVRFVSSRISASKAYAEVYFTCMEEQLLFSLLDLSEAGQNIAHRN